MKIYIVTDGCYSDYGIDNVFLDKAKAEEYVAIYDDDKRVEEYDTFEGELEKITAFYAKAKFDLVTHSMYDYQYSTKGMMPGDFDREETTYTKEGYLFGLCSGTSKFKHIRISRIISQTDYNEHHEIAKYMKVLQDIHKRILFMESQGMTEQEINKLL